MGNLGIYNLQSGDFKQFLEKMCLSREKRDVCKIVRSFGFQIYRTSPIDTEFMGQLGMVLATVTAFDDSKIIKIINSNRNSFQFNRFLTAYMFADYQLHCEEDTSFENVLFGEGIYQSDTYSCALDILLPDVLEDDLNCYELAVKYNVSVHMVKQKFSLLEQKGYSKVIR